MSIELGRTKLRTSLCFDDHVGALALALFLEGKSRATIIFLGVKVLDKSPTLSVRDVALVVDGKMLAFKHGIVDRMVIQIFVLDVPHFIGNLCVRSLNVGQWASRLSLEVVDEVVSSQLPPLHPQAEVLETSGLLGVMASMPSSNFFSSCILSTASSAFALEKSSEFDLSLLRICNAVQWQRPFRQAFP
jgi:hypothetical protein